MQAGMGYTTSPVGPSEVAAPVRRHSFPRRRILMDCNLPSRFPRAFWQLGSRQSHETRMGNDVRWREPDPDVGGLENLPPEHSALVSDRHPRSIRLHFRLPRPVGNERGKDHARARGRVVATDVTAHFDARSIDQVALLDQSCARALQEITDAKTNAPAGLFLDLELHEAHDPPIVIALHRELR